VLAGRVQTKFKKSQKTCYKPLTVRVDLTYKPLTNEADASQAQQTLLSWSPRKGVALAKTYLKLVSDLLRRIPTG